MKITANTKVGFQLKEDEFKKLSKERSRIEKKDSKLPQFWEEKQITAANQVHEPAKRDLNVLATERGRERERPNNKKT